MKLKISKDKFQIFIIYILFLFLTIVSTYPLIFNISTFQYGDGGDGPEFLWNLWHFKNAIYNLENPYYTDNLFFPSGTDLYLHSLSPLNCLISLPFQLLTNNLILVYNLLIIINFSFAAFTMYLFLFYLIKNKFSSFFSSLIFAFSPYMVGHSLGHLNLISLWPLPLFALYFLKFFTNSSYKNLLLSCFFLILATLGSWYIGIFCLFFSFVYILYKYLKKDFKLNSLFFKRLMLIYIIYFFLMSPLLINMKSSYPNYIVEKPGRFSPDFFSFIFPGNLSSFNFLFNNDFILKIRGISDQGAENQIFLGYINILLLFISIIYYLVQKRKKIFVLKEYLFWLLLFFLSLIFVLGTKLKFMGMQTEIPLPYLFFYSIFPVIFQSGRFMVLVYFSLSVLVSCGIKNLLNSKIFSRFKFFSFIFLLIFIEFLSIPFILTDYPVSDFYRNLGFNKENFAILDLNFDDTLTFYPSVSVIMYYQTFHNKKIVGGKISRFPSGVPHLSYYANNLSRIDDLEVKYIIFSQDSDLYLSEKYPLIYEDYLIRVYEKN